MRPLEIVSSLGAFKRRGAGTDAERRAAVWLRDALTERSWDARLETFWCRPNWPLAHAWHVLLGLVGSLLATTAPTVGAVVVGVALASVVIDELVGISPGRLLTRSRASQNVVASAPLAATRPGRRRRLLITAFLDVPRDGLVNRAAPRLAASRGAQRSAGRGPGWLGWVTILLGWLLVVALLRAGGTHTALVRVAQLIPTAALVLTLAALLELALAPFEERDLPGAAALAVAVTLARALGAAPPGELAVELVVQGAGDGQGAGLRRQLRARRREIRPGNTIVLALARCGRGSPGWWRSEGPLVPLRPPARLRELAEGIAAAETELELSSWPSRRTGPALAARRTGLASITITTGPPAIATAGGLPSATTLDALVEFGSLLADAVAQQLADQPVATPG